MKTVSVIVPVYNAVDYVEKCVDSLMHQTYRDIEIILVNDASTDGSDVICQRLCTSNDRIKYLSNKKNSGQTITRNKGVDAATGNWMLFLDVDDYLVADTIESMVAVSERDQCDIVMTNYKTVTDKGKETVFRANIKEGSYSTGEFVKQIFSPIRMEVVSCIGTKLYRLDFVRNKKQKTIVKTNYDLAFILDALMESPSISYLDKVTYVYLQREGSITHSYRNEMYFNLTEARKHLKPLLERYGCYEDKINYYQLMRYTVIRWSLMQEVEYKKGYNHYKTVFDTIYCDPNTSETINVMIKTSGDKKRKILMNLIKGNHRVLTYLMLKAYLFLS